MTRLNTPSIWRRRALAEDQFVPSPDRWTDTDSLVTDQPAPAEACTDVGGCCTGTCNQGDDCPIRAAQAATALPRWFGAAAVAVFVLIGAMSYFKPWGFFQ